MHRERYLDRADAGAVLGELLATELSLGAAPVAALRDDVVVLGLARGGMPVAAAVADRLRAPLQVIAVRKLGLPGQPELAMGALAAVGDDTLEMVRNDDVIAHCAISEGVLQSVCHREEEALRAAQRRYSGAAPEPQPRLRGRTLIVVDDGFATGASMRAVLAALRRCEPALLVAAFPVGPADARARLGTFADQVVCAWTPPHFSSVGQAYVDFGAISDEQVRSALAAPR